MVQPETEYELNSCVWMLLIKSANASWSGADYYLTLLLKPVFSECCGHMIRNLAICHFCAGISALLGGGGEVGKFLENKLKGKRCHI